LKNSDKFFYEIYTISQLNINKLDKKASKELETVLKNKLSLESKVNPIKPQI